LGICCYLKQILQDGFFQADPHPGNIAVSIDGNLIFYDFGMMAEVKALAKDQMIKAFFAVLKKDTDVVLTTLVDIGLIEPVSDMKPVRKMVKFLLEEFKEVYFVNGAVPNMDSKFKIQLFNTFRSFIDLKEYFPKSFNENIDERGAFVEVMRHGISGQTSYSTTVPGVTRGNHYHTRKIERFAVIKGKALIELRKIGTSEILSFKLDGSQPAYVDMPIWYTHNIKNIGQEELLTMFWINEPYDLADPDTYFEKV
jgi:dTDP-4-dehydrorhamnose 3,5-epimerase-like enzyme